MSMSKEIQTSSWMPGDDWTGGPFETIWSQAARRNESVAGMMFGLMVWYTFMHHDEDWMFHHYEQLADGLSLLILSSIPIAAGCLRVRRTAPTAGNLSQATDSQTSFVR